MIYIDYGALATRYLAFIVFDLYFTANSKVEADDRIRLAEQAGHVEYECPRAHHLIEG